MKSLALRITLLGAVVVIVSLGYRWLLVNRLEIIQTGAYYSAPSVNTIAGTLNVSTSLDATIPTTPSCQ